MSKIDTVTQEYVKKVLHYNPETGIFTWLATCSNRAVKGSIVSCTDPHGYICLRVNNVNVRAHRLAYLYIVGKWPDNYIDHINGNTSDNRWVNLRHVTSAVSSKNKGICKRCRFGLMGIDIAHGKYRVRIRDKGKEVHLGLYVDFFEACCARKSAESKYNYHPNHGRQKW